MDVHFSWKTAKTAVLENQAQTQIKKLEKYLRVFRPDLVHLKGTVEESNTRQGFACSLNLRLPTGQLATEQFSPSADLAVRAAFEGLAAQVKKHKSLLRNQRGWPRRQGVAVETIPFEDTMALVRPDPVTPADVARYVDVNLPRLQRFIDRQIAYRETEGQLRPEQIAREDALNEAIANALDDRLERPERFKLEPWLYRLASEAIHHIALQEGPDGSHPGQPPYNRDDIFVDTSNPEDLATRRELIDQVQKALRGAGALEREAFILFTIEGFTVDEVADITNHNAEEVRGSIRKAREHLEVALPIKDPLKDKLVAVSWSA